ncbi:MAG: aminotransferase class V-fold PLP-dependent enzyme, partial [Planctomycetota bacterium]
MEPVYLDHNATTRPSDAVCAAVDAAQREAWANPSSVHRAGQDARYRLETARRSLAGLCGVDPKRLVLCSGGTEAAQLAVFGALGASPWK